MSTVDDIYNRYQYNGKSYGRFNVKDAVTGEEFSIAEDADGNLYQLDEKGVPTRLDTILKNKILRGDAIVKSDIDESKARAKKEAKAALKNSPYRDVMPPMKKTGGVILKPLPVKLQTGSRLLTEKSEVQDPGKITDPMSHASGVFTYGLKNMSNADKRDISAAILDLLSAIAGFSPDPISTGLSVVGGLTATGLMARSD